MPDGDVVHDRLRRLYKKPYKWLFLHKATNDDCAQVVMEALKKDLKQNGNLPVTLAQSMSGRLAQVISASDENSLVDWGALGVESNRLVQKADGRPDLKELILRAGKSVLHDLRYGQEIEVGNASVVIIERYMSEVYESQFKECVPLSSEHYGGVDPVTFAHRIEAMQPNINVGIGKFAKDAIRHRF